MEIVSCRPKFLIGGAVLFLQERKKVHVNGATENGLGYCLTMKKSGTVPTLSRLG